jgi:tRNA(Arg) A34 adenosine deaminase TadA
MRAAIGLALENIKNGGGPFGAVVARGGEIVGRGANRVTATNDPTAHAEILAIRDACRRLGTFQLEGCELYTSCEPCPMCLGAAYWARPAKIHFAATQADAAAAGFDDAFIFRQFALPAAERSLPQLPFLRGEALAVFEVWKNHAGRVEY